MALEYGMKQGKGNRVLPRERPGHSKHPFPTTKDKTLHMDSTRWSTPKSDWLYSLQPKMEKLYIVSKNKTGNCLWLRSWTPYAKFRLKLKKVGKTTSPLKYDLNQIPYDYTVKVKSLSRVPTLSDPMDCSLPGSSVHGIFQARVPEWGAIAFYL